MSHCVGVALWLRNTIDQLKHMLVLLYRRSRIIIILLHTRNKGENFNMLLKFDRPAESHTFFHLFFTYNNKFYYSSTFNAREIFVTQSLPTLTQNIFNSLNNYFYFYLADFNLVKFTRGLQFHACVWISGRSISSRSASGLNTSTSPSLVGSEFSASPSTLQKFSGHSVKSPLF